MTEVQEGKDPGHTNSKSVTKMRSLWWSKNKMVLFSMATKENKCLRVFFSVGILAIFIKSIFEFYMKSSESFPPSLFEVILSVVISLS